MNWTSKPVYEVNPTDTKTAVVLDGFPFDTRTEWINTVGQSVPKLYDNKLPTHDPYTNPNAQIYYECDCGAILDPGTKSFAALNNAASDKGWKIRFGEVSYKPYCVECGKDVE